MRRLIPYRKWLKKLWERFKPFSEEALYLQEIRDPKFALKVIRGSRVLRAWFWLARKLKRL